jgi:hypothetical protein
MGFAKVASWPIGISLANSGYAEGLPWGSPSVCELTYNRRITLYAGRSGPGS